MKTDIEIAKLAHNLHNEFCVHTSFPIREWDELPQEHIDTMLSTIDKIRKGEVKSPIESHSNYVKRKEAEGISNDRTVSWDDLVAFNQWKEIMFFSLVRELLSENDTVEEQKGGDAPSLLEETVKPAIKFLNDHYHPHTKIIVSTTGAEIVRGTKGFQTFEFVKD